MPKLDTKLHLDMFGAGKRQRTLGRRMQMALRALLGRDNPYGLEWGDPETLPPLKYVRDHFLLPYLTPTARIVEIGPGGGRWTRYMSDVQQVYAVDFHGELLEELRKGYAGNNLTYVKNNGSDFPGIPHGSIDFVWSFGVFVHLDIEIITSYLANMKSLLKPDAVVVIQYADKRKPIARDNDGFSQNDPNTMRRLVQDHGYSIQEEDTLTMWHSSIVRFSASVEAAPSQDLSIES